MSIASEITRLQNIKASIRSKLIAKGVDASNHDMEDFITDIDNIPSGSDVRTSDTGTITVTDDTLNKIRISHNLNALPVYFSLMYDGERESDNGKWYGFEYLRTTNENGENVEYGISHYSSSSVGIVPKGSASTQWNASDEYVDCASGSSGRNLVPGTYTYKAVGYGQPIPVTVLTDLIQMADDYNTGCKGVLDSIKFGTIYDIGSNYTGNLKSGDSYNSLDFYGKDFSTMSEDIEFYIKNTDFSDKSLRLMNISVMENTNNYDVYVHFENCKFSSVGMSDQNVCYQHLKFIFDNCTSTSKMSFEGCGASVLNNCNLKTVNSDASDFNCDVVLNRCYIEVNSENTGTESHTDGIQYWGHNSGVEFNIEFNNCRIVNPKLCSNVATNASLMMQPERSSINSLIINNTYLNGGGYISYFNPKSSLTINSCEIDGLYFGNNKVYGDIYPSANYDVKTQANPFITYKTQYLIVGSVFVDNGYLKVVVHNDTGIARTLKVETNLGIVDTFTIPKCPTYEEALDTLTLSDFPWNLVKNCGKAHGVEWIKCYDTTNNTNTLIRESEITYTVPQTGTWQYKITPTNGYIILGKDDDTHDEAMFVRMISGYGFPVTLNSIIGNAYDVSSHHQTDDGDSEYSLYPSGSISRLPDGGTIHDVNRIVIDNNLGEIAQHGYRALWNSEEVTDDTWDLLYENYTTGGGTKTKAEMIEAFKEDYADIDIAKGAPYFMAERQGLEEDLQIRIQTIGTWGVTHDFYVDDIVVAGPSDINISAWNFAREYDYWGAGMVTTYGNSAKNPWEYPRRSGGLVSVSNLDDACQYAYDNLGCVEIFTHQYFNGHGTQEQWTTFKNMMDRLAEWVDDGKIQVVTRYEFSQLGEIVDNPITSIMFSSKELQYDIGHTFTSSDFNCNAVLSDLNILPCEEDMVVDLSQIDETTSGNYTATLYYRGFKANCTVRINGQPVPEYIIENGSYSGDSMVNGTNYCAETFDVVEGKTYHLEFDFSASTTVQYSSHYIDFAGGKKTGLYPTTWCGNSAEQIAAFRINTTEGTTTEHISVDVVSNRTSTEDNILHLFKVQNTGIGAWSITNLYLWEVPEEPTYIIENGSWSGESMTRNTAILPVENVSVESGKTYHIEFDFLAETSVQYSPNYMTFCASHEYGKNPSYWGEVTSETDSSKVLTTDGTTSAHMSFDITSNASYQINYLIDSDRFQNVTVGHWSITNLYMWEVE